MEVFPLILFLDCETGQMYSVCRARLLVRLVLPGSLWPGSAAESDARPRAELPWEMPCFGSPEICIFGVIHFM